MRIWLALLGLVFLATPAWATDEVDLFASKVTNYVMNGDNKVTSGVVGNFGTYLRIGCEADCWVALSATNFEGTFGVDNSATAAVYIPTETIYYTKTKGEKYVVFLGASGTIHITEMTP